MENEARGNFGENIFSQYCFDATIAFAYALNNSLNGIYETGTFLNFHSIKRELEGFHLVGTIIVIYLVVE